MANTETTKTPTIAAEIARAEEGMPTSLTLKFSNGKSLTIRATQLSMAMEKEALYHGLKQKLVDAAAIARNPETGRSATVDDKFEAVREVYDRLLAGSWNAPREGGGSGSLLFKALCRVKSTQEPSAIRDWLAARSAEEKKALEANPTIAAAIAEIRAEQAKATGIDSDALLDDLK